MDSNIAQRIASLTTDRDDIRDALVSKGISEAASHGYDDFANDILSIPTGGEQAQLNSPTLSNDEYTGAGPLTIDSNNGPFVENYTLYSDDETTLYKTYSLSQSRSNNKVNIGTAESVGIPSGEAYYKFYASGANMQTSVSSRYQLYVRSIVTNLENVSESSSNPTKIFRGESATFTFSPDDGYMMPNSIQMQLGTYSAVTIADGETKRLRSTESYPTATYSKATGTITLTDNRLYFTLGETISINIVGETIPADYYTVNITYEEDYTDYSMSQMTITSDVEGQIVTVYGDVGSASVDPDYITATTKIILQNDTQRNWYSLNGGSKTEIAQSTTVELPISGDSTLHLWVSCDS